MSNGFFGGPQGDVISDLQVRDGILNHVSPFDLGGNLATAAENTPVAGYLARQYGNPEWDYDTSDGQMSARLGHKLGLRDRPRTYEEFLAERGDSVWKSDNDYRNSPEYDARIQWRPRLSKKWQAELSGQLNNQSRREAYNVGHETASYVTQMVGGLLDPTFYLPVTLNPVSLWFFRGLARTAAGARLGAAAGGLGPASVRQAFGAGWRAPQVGIMQSIKSPTMRHFADVSAHGFDAAMNTMLFENMTAEGRKMQGQDPVSPQDIIHNAAWAFLLGGAIRGITSVVSSASRRHRLAFEEVEADKALQVEWERLANQMTSAEFERIIVGSLKGDAARNALATMMDPADNMNVTGAFAESEKAIEMRRQGIKSLLDEENARRHAQKGARIDEDEATERALSIREPKYWQAKLDAEERLLASERAVAKLADEPNVPPAMRDKAIKRMIDDSKALDEINNSPEVKARRKAINQEIAESNRQFEKTGRHPTDTSQDILPGEIKYKLDTLETLPRASTKPGRIISHGLKPRPDAPDIKTNVGVEEVAKAREIDIETGKLSEMDEAGLEVMEREGSISAEDQAELRAAERTIEQENMRKDLIERQLAYCGEEVA